MSTPEAEAPAGPAPGNSGPAPEQPKGDTPPGEAARQDGEGGPDEQDQPQNAWTARRELLAHSPRTMSIGGGTFDGGLVGGAQYGGNSGTQHGGISGGEFSGDVFLGSKTEIYQLALPGTAAPAYASVEVPEADLDRLAAHFVADEDVMSRLLDRLRRERVLVLHGGRRTGRRTAALMLLHRLGASPVRTLDSETGPSALAEQFDGDTAATGPDGKPARGYVLCDPATRRDSPLREHHLLAARHRLADQDAHLVVTVGPTAVLEDVSAEVWPTPAAADVLAARLHARVDEVTAAKLLGHPQVTEFLGRAPQLRETEAFAGLLARYGAGEVAEEALARFSLASLENQVREWFEEDEAAVHLRDKAFLVALAAFDDGPYALTAELSDLLFRFLLRTENPALVPEVPVFGTHIGKRLQLARAEKYEDDEHTEWGPVTQQKARFVDERASLVLLREVWTGHPSARPALIEWLRRLADDGRPLVRTRAASTVAVLARTDLPSAMALVIEPWATSPRFRHRHVAVNSLTFAHVIGTPNIPRILDAWSKSEDRRLRWVAVRAYALIGPELPDQALAALRDAARRLHADLADPDDFDLETAAELAEAVSLLLLSSAGDRVLAELRHHLDDDRAVHDLTLHGFVSACRRTENDERYGRPLVLDWYARAATDGGQAAEGVPFLWRRALGDRETTRTALDVLREWVLIADRSTAAEWTLAALLPQLVTHPTEHHRLSHLLRTMPGADGAPPPQVAARLLTTLPPR
jgi:hypothetical protein